MNMFVTLETSDLILKSADPRFAENLLQYYLRNKDDLEAYEPKREAAFFTLAHQEALLEQAMKASDYKAAFRFYCFTKADAQTIIGSVGLSHIVWVNFLSCLLNYNLDAEYTDKDYMTQAVSEVVQYAFQTLRLHRIEANIMPRNIPSRRVLEKCGFVKEGVSPQYLYINGVWEDHIHMVLLNEALIPQPDKRPDGFIGRRRTIDI
jgi:ribosomal-protein-alanine N-acetyltransferase